MSGVTRPPDPGPGSLADPLAGWPAGGRWQQTFPGDRQQLGVVRRWLASLLPERPERDDVTLVVTELATNAIVHTASGRGGSFAVTVGICGNVARVCVADGGAADGPRFLADPWGEHGRGLLVVSGLSARTGVCGDHRGRVVWADVPWASAGAAEPVPDPGSLTGGREPWLAARWSGWPACSARHPGTHRTWAVVSCPMRAVEDAKKPLWRPAPDLLTPATGLLVRLAVRSAQLLGPGGGLLPWFPGEVR